nr:411_t:CDS:1 [Entrophospora candida]
MFNFIIKRFFFSTCSTYKRNQKKRLIVPKVLKLQQQQPIKRISRLGKHHDLNSYIKSFESAEGDNKIHKGTVYKGTIYEYETVKCLENVFGIVSRRVGGAGDKGIDLRGQWFLSENKKFNIIGQCKNLSQSCKSSSVREFEGTLCHESLNTIGILSSKSGFSKNSISRFQTSPMPLILMKVSQGGNNCELILFNDTANKLLH